jgi:hypothetical protein
MQLPPAAHATQVPPALHTIPLPHVEPVGRAEPRSEHTGAPLPHAI